jgi:hypothetical protein
MEEYVQKHATCCYVLPSTSSFFCLVLIRDVLLEEISGSVVVLFRQ